NGPVAPGRNSGAAERQKGGTTDAPDKAQWNIQEALAGRAEPAHEFGHLMGIHHAHDVVGPGVPAVVEWNGATHAQDYDYKYGFSSVIEAHRAMGMSFSNGGSMSVDNPLGVTYNNVPQTTHILTMWQQP